MSLYISSAAWFNPVYIDYYSAAYNAAIGAKMFYDTIASMSRPDSSAVAAMPSVFQTMVQNAAYAGQYDYGYGVVSQAYAERGIGINIDVIV